MHVCFIDEAGDLGALSNPPLPEEQPVLVIGGLFVDAANLAALTGHFLDLKHRFFPGLRYPSLRPLDRILAEIKGSDIRRLGVDIRIFNPVRCPTRTLGACQIAPTRTARLVSRGAIGRG